MVLEDSIRPEVSVTCAFLKIVPFPRHIVSSTVGAAICINNVISFAVILVFFIVFEAIGTSNWINYTDYVSSQ